MECIDLPLGLKLFRPSVFADSRGFFLETYQQRAYAAAGVDVTFVQDNHSRSTKGTLRGLHYQSHPGQAKLVRVGRGRIFDVAVDIRPDSPTFGRWHGVYLDDQEHAQLLVPVGFAHGFCVVSDIADVMYKVSAPYDPKTECGLKFDDPDVGVAWPISEPLLSPRDQQAESFATYRARHQK
jgi:dTDP-4-dehydrorhamnose 3,5-epimerase